MSASPPAEVCFFEHNPRLALARRAGAEAVGTLLLMLAASASASVTLGLTPGTGAGALLHAMAASGALVSLIVALGPVSGGHFNPIITIGQWMRGERSLRCLSAYVPAQAIGALAGGVLSRLLFPQAPIRLDPMAWPLLTSELIGTASLMLIVFACSRAKRAEVGPFAVSAWLLGMILFLPSSYANPALVIGGLIANGPIAISGLSAAAFIPVQIVGGLLAVGIVGLVYGHTGEARPAAEALP